ncbi:MAG: HAD-IIB family hydrolase [Nitrospirota bacterium]
MAPYIIFSDLDGTLLHPKTYSFEEALPALRLLKEKHIPLVLCSSKTRAEIEVYRRHIETVHPFIVENGGGIYIPQGYFSFPVEEPIREGFHVLELGTPYADIRKAFIRLRNELGISVKGFGDMTAQEVASLTGLTIEQAVFALQREYGEPFIFADHPDERFLQAIEASGLHWTQGRLFHVMGNHHKGMAVNKLKALFEREYGSIITIGLGDGLNDFPFLFLVDHPVFIRNNRAIIDPPVTIPNLYYTNENGPRGWNEAILQLLQNTSQGNPSVQGMS